MDTPIHELQIPDALLEWGKDPQRARSWTKPWAHQLDRMLRYASKNILTSSETDAVLAALEGLCAEAIRAGEHELLLGIDLYTAEWLGLRFDVETNDGSTVTFGEDVTYPELHVMLAAGAECIPDAMKLKALVSDVFPEAKIDAMVRTEDMPPDICSGGCGTQDARLMLTLEQGNRYCAACYSKMTRPESHEKTAGARRR